LVFFLQGCCSDYSTWPGQTGYNTLADTAKIILCYPAAINTQSQLNNRDWDVTSDRDLVFILALLDTAVKKFNIDKNRVYATGHSMGAYMSNYLACTYPEKFAAIAPVAGCNLTIKNLTSPQYDRTNCKKTRPVSVLHMHGTSDAGISYDNGLRSVQSWVTLDGCPSTAQVTQKYKGAAKAKLEVYGPCNGNAEVAMLSIEGLAHVWLTKSNSGVSGTEEGWNFMKRFSITTTGSTDAASESNLQPHSIQARYAGRTIILHPADDATGVSLLDTKGRTIGTWNDLAGQHVLPVRSLPCGIYLLSIERSNGNVFLRLSVQ
jgi:poly(3-hydroxybutyrate) depolymerase